MKYFDAAIIGGGILGCFTARNLQRYSCSSVLIEAEDDVCTGITRANSAIVYAGYDNKAGSLKAEMTVRGNANFDKLCRELDVPFSRCGSLLVTYDENAVNKLKRKYDEGLRNGVTGLSLLSGEAAENMEPMLRPGVAAALYAPTTGTVNPWKLGIAAYENALHNGCTPLLSNRVISIARTDEGYLITTEKEQIACRAVLNCAGLYADAVQEMLFSPTVRLELDAADYLVLDRDAQKPNRVIFFQADACGKGITAIPCVEGNLLLSGVRRPLTSPFATTNDGLLQLHTETQRLLPEVQTETVIRSFAAVRPNPYVVDGSCLHDFCIEYPDAGFYSLIGVKTPGLTCANELGTHLAKKAAEHLQADENPLFDPCRPAISDTDHEIICQCEQISKAEILEAIKRGAATVDGVKRRVGSGMGRCQGSRCRFRIEQLLEDVKHGNL